MAHCAPACRSCPGDSARISRSTPARSSRRRRGWLRRSIHLGEGVVTRPRLVVDGDSFAHRSYHALPKSLRRAGNRGAGAIVGFANFLLRLYETERPRAVLVGWDTLG